MKSLLDVSALYYIFRKGRYYHLNFYEIPEPVLWNFIEKISKPENINSSVFDNFISYVREKDLDIIKYKGKDVRKTLYFLSLNVEKEVSEMIAIHKRTDLIRIFTASRKRASMYNDYGIRFNMLED